MYKFALLVVAVTLLSGSIVQAASYQKTDGTVVDPIMHIYGGPHIYSGSNLEPEADLDSANLTDYSGGSPYYYGNTTFSNDYHPVANGWILAPYCDFTPDATCDLKDINQMLQAGNLVTGVVTSESNDRPDLVDNDTIDAAGITEWLAQAASENGHGSAYLRGDTELDRDVDITDFNSLASNFDPDGATAPHSWLEGNFDGDDDIDITDFNFLASNFAPDGYGASAVPEPSSLLLALLGLILLVGVRVQ